MFIKKIGKLIGGFTISAMDFSRFEDNLGSRGSIPGKIPNFKSKIPIPYLYLGRGKVEVVYLKLPREGTHVVYISQHWSELWVGPRRSRSCSGIKNTRKIGSEPVKDFIFQN